MPSAKSLFILWVLNWNSPASVVDGFDLSTTSAQTKQNLHLGRGRKSLVSLESGDPDVATRPTEKISARTQIDESLLLQLEKCETGTAARRLLERALSIENRDDYSYETRSIGGPLFGSIRIPAGLSDRTISDGDLAIQTKIRNKKYGIFDLVDTNGDRDADRAAAAVFGVFLASSLSAIAVNENLPGPEIVRFVVVWILSFAPL